MCVMSRDDPHFRLRVPPELHDRVAAAAKENGRSMNAEIVVRLELSFASGSDEKLDTILRNLDTILRNFDSVRKKHFGNSEPH